MSCNRQPLAALCERRQLVLLEISRSAWQTESGGQGSAGLIQYTLRAIFKQRSAPLAYSQRMAKRRSGLRRTYPAYYQELDNGPSDLQGHDRDRRPIQ